MKLYHRVNRLISRLGWKHWLAILAVSVYLLDYFGIFLRLKSRSYRRDYSYPLEGNIHRYVEEMKKGESPSIRPIYHHNYRFIKNPKLKCLTEDGNRYVPLRVVYLVKSAVDHFEERRIIRKTWGYERRFSDVPLRTVFLVGQTNNMDHQTQLESEHLEFKDLVQGNFMDRYYNNSIKTAMGIRWAAEQCSRARFYLFVDDDYYVSTRNLLRFLRNPVGYPKYLEEDVISFDDDSVQYPKKRQRRSHQSDPASNTDVLDLVAANTDVLNNTDDDIATEDYDSDYVDEKDKHIDNGTSDQDYTDNISLDVDNNLSDNIVKGDNIHESNATISSDNSTSTNIKKESIYESDVVFKSRNLKQLVDFDLPEDVRLFAGQVFPESSPMRHRSSKWFVTLDEYPFDTYPPFITAGAYILSRAALIDMYYTSYFTKLFRFDDIWLGMIAKKANLEPFHSPEFYLWRKPYSVRGYRYVIASHGFEDSNELLKIWEEQKMAGNA